jgi:hypothetical protein
MRFLLLTCLLVSPPFEALLAQTPENCLTLVRDTYRKINRATTNLAEDQVYYFKATVKTVMRDSAKSQNSESTFEMIAGKRQVRYLTKDMVSFQDEKNAFTIIPSRQVIYWSDSMLKLARAQGLTTQLMLQDTLFTMSTVTKCEDIRYDDQADKVVELALNELAQRSFRLQTLTVYLNTKQQLIKRFLLGFTEKNEMKSMEIICDEINFHYQKTKLDTPAHALVFAENNRLLPKYQGYQVIDARAKK